LRRHCESSQKYCSQKNAGICLEFHGLKIAQESLARIFLHL
jgi:hypothetical protein